MRYPSLPNTEIINPTTGDLSDTHRAFFNNMVNTQQKHFNIHGILMPDQNTSTIEKLNTEDNSGKFLYDSESKEAKLNNQGTYKVISTVTDRLTTSQIGDLDLPKENGKFYEDTDTNKLFYVLNSTLKEVTLI